MHPHPSRKDGRNQTETPFHGWQSVECVTAVKQRNPFAALPVSQRGSDKGKQIVPVLNLSVDIKLYRKFIKNLRMLFCQSFDTPQ